MEWLIGLLVVAAAGLAFGRKGGVSGTLSKADALGLVHEPYRGFDLAYATGANPVAMGSVDGMITAFTGDDALKLYTFQAATMGAARAGIRNVVDKAIAGGARSAAAPPKGGGAPAPVVPAPSKDSYRGFTIDYDQSDDGSVSAETSDALGKVISIGADNMSHAQSEIRTAIDAAIKAGSEAPMGGNASASSGGSPLPPNALGMLR